MKCGLFTQDIVEGFQRLAAHPGMDHARLKEIVDALHIGDPDRYFGAVNRLLSSPAGHAADPGLLRRLVDHRGVQNLLIEEGPAAFTGLMRAAGDDLARVEQYVRPLDMLKRRAIASGGPGEYERLLAQLATGDRAAEDAIRHARRTDQLVGKLGPDIHDMVFDALRATDRNAFNSAVANLRSRLGQTASPQQLAGLEKGLLSSWRAEQLDLASHVPNLSGAERRVLDDLNVEQWDAIIGNAERRRGWHTREPDAAVFNLKGLLAEEVFYTSPDFRAALNRARATAIERGLDPDSVRLVRRPRGVTVSEITGRTSTGELTDGIIVANPLKQVDGRLERDLSEMHVLTVIESKSPSNVGHLAGDRPGSRSSRLPPKWHPDDPLPSEANYFGQLTEDFERFSELPTRFGETWYPPERVRIGSRWTEWIAIHPPGHPIPQNLAQRITGLNVNPMAGLVRDDVLNEVAAQVYRVLAL